MNVLCPTHNTPCRRVGAGSKVFFVCKQSGCKFVQWANSQDAPPASQSSPPQPPTSNPSPTPALSPTPTVTTTLAPTVPIQITSQKTPTVTNTINDSASDNPTPLYTTDQLPPSPQPQEPRKRIKLSQLKLSRPNTTPIIQNTSNINPKPILPTRAFFQSNTPTINNASHSQIKPKTEPISTDTVSRTSLPPSPSPKPNSIASNSNTKTEISSSTTQNKHPTSNNNNNNNNNNKDNNNVKYEQTKSKTLNKPTTLPPPPSLSPPATPTKQTIPNQSPKKTPTEEMKKNAAVLGASPMGKKAIPIDNPNDNTKDNPSDSSGILK